MQNGGLLFQNPPFYVELTKGFHPLKKDGILLNCSICAVSSIHVLNLQCGNLCE